MPDYTHKESATAYYSAALDQTKGQRPPEKTKGAGYLIRPKAPATRQHQRQRLLDQSEGSGRLDPD